MEYKNMSSEELKKERKVCLDQYEQCQEMGLSLDLSRSKSGYQNGNGHWQDLCVHQNDF